MFEFEITKGDSFAASVEEAIQHEVEEAIAEMERAASAIRCRAHGKPVTVRRTRSAGELTLEIDGCCQEAIDRAAATI